MLVTVNVNASTSSVNYVGTIGICFGCGWYNQNLFESVQLVSVLVNRIKIDKKDNMRNCSLDETTGIVI